MTNHTRFTSPLIPTWCTATASVFTMRMVEPHNPERLLRLLAHPQRQVQLIMTGKAHLVDLTRQALIQQWIRFIRPDVRPMRFSSVTTTCM